MPPCPACTSRIHTFERVAAGAQLEAWIDGDCASFASSLVIQTDVSPPGIQTIPHGAICRAPGGNQVHVEPLITPRLYIATFFVSFLSQAASTVTLNMCVRKADGQHLHAGALCCTLTGSQGDGTDYLTAFVKTFQS